MKHSRPSRLTDSRLDVEGDTRCTVLSRCTRPRGVATATASSVSCDVRASPSTRSTSRTDPGAAKLVERANHGNQTVPTLVFADGSALTNPSVAQVKAQLRLLSPFSPRGRAPHGKFRTMVDAVVCGAGAAGLAAGAALRRAGADVIVLERSDQVAASWRTRYPALRLNTPGWMSTQPGFRATRRRYGKYPVARPVDPVPRGLRRAPPARRALRHRGPADHPGRWPLEGALHRRASSTRPRW